MLPHSRVVRERNSLCQVAGGESPSKAVKNGNVCKV